MYDFAILFAMKQIFDSLELDFQADSHHYSMWQF